MREKLLLRYVLISVLYCVYINFYVYVIVKLKLVYKAVKAKELTTVAAKVK